jgi:hypothetical protein
MIWQRISQAWRDHIALRTIVGAVLIVAAPAIGMLIGYAIACAQFTCK